MMTKKDYIQFANMISTITNHHDKQLLTNKLISVFEKDNPAFDVDRFKAWIEDASYVPLSQDLIREYDQL